MKFSVWSWPVHVRGQFTVTANSWSRYGRVGVHDRGHFVDTESFTDEGVRSPFLTERGDDLFCRIQRLEFLAAARNKFCDRLAGFNGIKWNRNRNRVENIWNVAGNQPGLTRNKRGNITEISPSSIVAMARKSRGLPVPMARNWKP